MMSRCDGYNAADATTEDGELGEMSVRSASPMIVPIVVARLYAIDQCVFEAQFTNIIWTQVDNAGQ
jgi:hypothetical protein